MVSQDDVDGDAATVSFDVRREPRRLQMIVRLADDDPRASEIVQAATDALRRFDPYTDVIDVVAEPG